MTQPLQLVWDLVAIIHQPETSRVAAVTIGRLLPMPAFGVRRFGAAFVLHTSVEYSMLRHLDKDRADPKQERRQAAALQRLR